MLKIVTSILDLSFLSTAEKNVFSTQLNYLPIINPDSCPRAIALGNFDGVHQGHQKVIQPIFSCELPPNTSPSLVTFFPHPQEFFSGEKKPLLTPIEEKSILLENLGVKELILLPFSQELANLTPEEFVLEILIKKINAVFISIGEDFRFGYQRQGDAQSLKQIASKYNVHINITTEQKIITSSPEKQSSQRISSSFIRNNLNQGKITEANQMLGREYQLTGKVVTGKQLGRTIGFPTANLAIPAEKFVPKNGVYAVKVTVEDTDYIDLPAVMNIGNRPTVQGKNKTIEVHMFDWQEDLYEQNLLVKLVEFIRPEQKFASLEQLKTQIGLDSIEARKILNERSRSQESGVKGN